MNILKEKDVAVIKEMVFKAELDSIVDINVRKFTKLCILEAPNYIFNNCPASTSGKHHPENELGADGNIKHTKKVVSMAKEIYRSLTHNKVTKQDGPHLDLVIAACIVHDLVKQGWTKTGHTQLSHPDYGASLVIRLYNSNKDLITKEQMEIIKNCVGFHYGPWSELPWKKAMSEYTPEELCVYMSDYVVSRRFVSVPTDIED